MTPISPELLSRIRLLLENCFPRVVPLSLLLVHISQLEHLALAPESVVLHKRQRYHAPASFLEQVLVNVRRAIRTDDQILAHDGTGAAIIFPEVDQQGAYSILERVHRSVGLLQAETVIPPLNRETDILMGIGSYPEPGSSIEDLLNHMGMAARRITLRPAITPQLWSIKHPATEEIAVPLPSETKAGQTVYSNPCSTVPFLHLPTRLPTRLKHLIPYQFAREFQCAPVGRDHHCLTVAMADPTNESALDHLRELTGMTIFPVACDVIALNILLADKW